MRGARAKALRRMFADVMRRPAKRTIWQKITDHRGQGWNVTHSEWRWWKRRMRGHAVPARYRYPEEKK